MLITIDHIAIEATAGQTVMQAAASAGIRIPSMCCSEGFHNHPSCMVCLVKDLVTGHLFPSCAMPVNDGMKISASSEDVLRARKEALELLLSDHAGDCEAPCRLSCPAFMDIPRMNRLISGNLIPEALRVVREEIALPLVLGYICPAPCENACRRKQIDGALSICLLKRFTAQDEAIRNSGLDKPGYTTGKRIAVIGTGPAGLSAAFYTLRMGHECVLYDKNELAGGALRYSIPDDILPKKMLDADIESIILLGGEFRLGCRITGESWEREIIGMFDAVILATGFREENPTDEFGLPQADNGQIIDKKTFASGRPGVFGCGSIISEQMLAVRSAAQGKKAAFEADAWLSGSRRKRKGHAFNCAIGPLKEGEELEFLKEAAPDQRTDPARGYLGGFDSEEAVREALRCMHCDCRKQDTCKLRSLAGEYGADRRHFSPRERIRMTRNLQHGLVVYEPEKCIRCGLCIEIAQREGEHLGLAFAGRGFDVRISVPFGRNLMEGLTVAADACADGCPTGALARKR